MHLVSLEGLDELLVAALVEHRNARLGDRGLVPAQAAGGPQARLRIILLVKPAVHSRLVVGPREEFAELLLHPQFDVVRKCVIAPGVTRHRFGALAVALREQSAGQRKLALGAQRLAIGEKTADGGGIRAILVEKPYSGAPHGAKGVGELPMDVGAPAVVAAIHDAVGVWIHDLPATPERILAALTDATPPPAPGISLEEPAPRTPPIEDLPHGGDEMPFRAPTDPGEPR